MGYCPQQNILMDYLSVQDNLRYFADLKGVTPDLKNKVVNEAITNLGLTEYKNIIASKLSGGNKRKL